MAAHHRQGPNLVRQKDKKGQTAKASFNLDGLGEGGFWVEGEGRKNGATDSQPRDLF